MIQCPHCASSEQQTKSGHTRTGSQRYKCKECQRIYTPEPKPLDYPDQTKREAVRLYLEGTNFHRTARILSVNHQSVINYSMSYSPLSAQKNASLRRHGGRSSDALYRRL